MAARLEEPAFVAPNTPREFLPVVGAPARPNQVEIPTGEFVMGPSDHEKFRDSQRQAWFQDAVNNKLNIPTGYQHVAALILRWHPTADSFREGHDEEIEKLKQLFEGSFNYDCTVVTLGTSKKPQNALNLAIAQHVATHDGPNNLLIVYYTGHGRLVGPVDGNQRLKLSANTSSSGKRNGQAPHPATAYWDTAEIPLLESSDSHVLAILDCCFASNAHKGYFEDRRVYELIAASPRNQGTPAPGRKSFTTALIESLKECLAESGPKGFRTPKLLDKINKNRFVPSMLYDRLYKHDGHVQLVPLDKDPYQGTERPSRSFKQEKAWVKFRCSLEEPQLSQDQIEALGPLMVTAFHEAKIPGIRRIDWLKMESSDPSTPTRSSSSLPGTVMAVSAGQLWRKKSQNSSRSGLGWSDGSQALRSRNRSASSTESKRSSGQSFDYSDDNLTSPMAGSPVEAAAISEVQREGQRWSEPFHDIPFPMPM